jgi:hypothetical protein
MKRWSNEEDKALKSAIYIARSQGKPDYKLAEELDRQGLFPNHTVKGINCRMTHIAPKYVKKKTTQNNVKITEVCSNVKRKVGRPRKSDKFTRLGELLLEHDRLVFEYVDNKTRMNSIAKRMEDNDTAIAMMVK